MCKPALADDPDISLSALAQFPTVQVRRNGKVVSQYQPGSFFEASLMKWLEPVLEMVEEGRHEEGGKKKKSKKRGMHQEL